MKQVISYLFLPFLFGIVILSCSENELINEDINLEINIEQTENFITLDEARDFASRLEYSIHQNIKNSSSRSNYATDISKEIETITEVPDQNDNTSCYVVNYEEDGFVIIAADKRSEPILAFSNAGKFSFDEESYPIGLTNWLSSTKESIENIRINNTEQQKEIANAWENPSTIKNIIPSQRLAKPKDVMPGDDDFICIDKTTIVGPLLQTKWQQGASFNALIPDQEYNGVFYPVSSGCTTVAIAQVIRYHEYPDNYNWNGMPNGYATNSTAILFRDIASAIDIKIAPDDVTLSVPSDNALIIPAFIDTFGYSSITMSDFNVYTVKSDLTKNRPVILMGGSRHGWFLYSSFVNGHMWVCDGYMTIYTCEFLSTSEYLHMRWGAGGIYDGWYYYNNWNPTSENVYNYRQEMLHNIVP